MTHTQTWPMFCQHYSTSAKQLDTLPIRTAWFAMGLTGIEAARWANMGFLPSEAACALLAGDTIEAIEARELAAHP
jgi:hypothetical protein